MPVQPHRSRLAAAVTVATTVIGAGIITTIAAQPAAAAAGCGATYTIASEWNNGFSATVSVTNVGDPLSSWTLTWTYADGQQIAQAWNATVSQSGSQVTARSVSHNGSLGTGATTSFGFNGSWRGVNSSPVTFSLNGTVCTGAPATGAPTTPPGGGPTTSPTPRPPADNPDWGRALPPAGAAHSRAYHIIAAADGTGYVPRATECSRDVHARYWAYGPDGKVYPTWHPARDPSGCTFGHEHGDDPRTSDLYSGNGWPPFGYTSEVMLDSMPGHSHRHEDHVGHKVLAVNNSNVIQGDNGSSFFPPQGPTIAVCDILLKFHQGTHSPDAFSNNVHELLLNERCTASNGGQVTEARYNAMIPLGRAGGFSPSECPGFGGPFINVTPPVPSDSPSDTRSLGRLISEPGCVQAIREGRTHRDPLYPNPVPFTVSDMDDFWFSDVQVTGPGLSFRLAPLFYVVNPSRYYDPSKPNRLGRIVDLCYTDLAGGDYCEQARRVTAQTGQQVAWDDPRSPFKGTLREFRPGSLLVQNSGAATVYTDVYGRNASRTPFAGSIEQRFTGAGGTTLYVRGSTKDYAGTAADAIHAPN